MAVRVKMRSPDVAAAVDDSLLPGVTTAFWLVHDRLVQHTAFGTLLQLKMPSELAQLKMSSPQEIVLVAHDCPTMKLFLRISQESQKLSPSC